MRYVMKQKFFSLSDNFTIKDQNQVDQFIVKGKLFSIGDRLSLEDTSGKQLLSIEQKLLSFGKTYFIKRGEQVIATVKKKVFTLFREVFDVEDAAAGELDATGDFFDHEYRFTRDGKTIASVSKKFFSLSDTYGIDINEGEDAALIIAIAVVIDQCSHDD